MKHHIPENDMECCGCGVCAVSCPVQAIKMIETPEGFIMPKVDEETCILCGKCDEKCTFLHAGDEKYEAAQHGYAAAARDPSLLNAAASGGVFAGIAEYVLENDGIVYGASWNSDFSIEHIGVTKREDIKKLQGSKYSQSRIYQILSELRQHLEEGKLVLFSGVPCQVASLKQYLGKNYHNLICIDLVCHGVGSNRMLRDDIQYLEQRYGKKISAVSFRSKRKGWGSSGDVIFSDGSVKDYTVLRSAYYYYYYLENAIFRKSCYHCPFAAQERTGDLTIGDFWRIESTGLRLDFDPYYGVSCVLVNTETGKKIVSCAGDRIRLVPAPTEAIIARNGQLRHACKCPDKRDKIFDIYTKQGYEKVVNYWRKTTRLKRAEKQIIQLCPRSIKTVLKSIRK